MRKTFLAIVMCMLVFAFTVEAGALTVDIYSGFNSSGSGAPFSGLVGSFSSPDISFAANTGYNWHPYQLGAFGAEITGYILVGSAGSYSFGLNSDDGSALFIDGALAVNNGGDHSPSTLWKNCDLTAGVHAITVQFYEDHGGPSGVDLYLPCNVRYYDQVPEPASMLLLGLGLVGLAGFRKRMK